MMESVGCLTRIPRLKKSRVFCGTLFSLMIAQSISPKSVRTPACDYDPSNSSPASDISLPCHVSLTGLPFLAPLPVSFLDHSVHPHCPSPPCFRIVRYSYSRVQCVARCYSRIVI